MHTIAIASAETYVFRFPVENPVKTSFGIMHDRPAVLVRLEDEEGAHGWGEVWCNFPTCGAEHRARLVTEVLLPILKQQGALDPFAVRERLTSRTHILSLQCGEPGPLAQAIAGIDIAVMDLAARKQGLPLWKMLGGEHGSTLPVYASGINPGGALETIARCREEGYTAFKVKVGFDRAKDLKVLIEVQSRLDAGELFMIDANQAWSLDQAKSFCSAVEEAPLQWIEEPMPVDSPKSHWMALAEHSTIPLAGGENLRGLDQFQQVLDAGFLHVFQPDACKWGGVTGALEVARRALAANKRYCPHYLGGGIGLIASAHILAAAGGDGLLEVDINPNPLRELLAAPFPQIRDNGLTMPKSPGLGVEPDMQQAKPFLKVAHQ